MSTKLLGGVANFYLVDFLKHIFRLPHVVRECQASLVHIEKHVGQTYHIVSTTLDHKVHGIFTAEREVPSKSLLLCWHRLNMIALGIQEICYQAKVN